MLSHAATTVSDDVHQKKEQVKEEISDMFENNDSNQAAIFILVSIFENTGGNQVETEQCRDEKQKNLPSWQPEMNFS